MNNSLKNTFFVTMAVLLPFPGLCISGEIHTDSIEHKDTLAMQEQEQKITDLDKIVVTATRTKRKISETPASVTTISEDEIDLSPARDVNDLIQHETGVQLKRLAGIGEGVPSDIIMRAIPGSYAATRVLVLVDGIPTNVSGTPFLIINEIPRNAIKRIEIVRGPYSSLYGANAFAGCINVITVTGDGPPSHRVYFENSYPFTVAKKVFDDDNHQSTKTILKKSARETYWNIEAQSNGGNEDFDYLVSGGFRNTGNYLVNDSAFRKGPYEEYRIPAENYDYRDFRLFTKAGYRINDRVRLEFHGRYFNSNLGFGKTKAIPDTHDVVTEGEKFLVGPRCKIRAADWLDLKIGGYYRKTKGDFFNEWSGFPDDMVDGTIASVWSSYSDDWMVEAQGIFTLGRSHIVTAGVENLWNTVSFGAARERETGRLAYKAYSVDKGIVNFGAYLQDEISFGKIIDIVPGIRFDYHSSFGSAFSPKLGINYKPVDHLRFRLSAGRAFRAPAFSELFMPVLLLNDDSRIISNPELKPENLWAVDGGISVFPISSLTLSLGLFHNWMSDLILPNPDPENFSWGKDKNDIVVAVTHRNISEAWSKGIEGELTWASVPWFMPFLNGVYQTSWDEEYDYPLDYIPKTMINFGWRTRKQFGNVFIEGSVAEGYVGERYYLDWENNDIQQWLGEDSMIVVGSDGLVLDNVPSDTLKSYWRTDVKLSAEFGERYRIDFVATNLFNATILESKGTLSPKRFASIGFGIAF
ncbi:MAG: TonB-dependent receptor [Chitinivibrionales bacterium]|nr:TonB-dependent receptor [Chitinivibrionales bacterium]